ncbi:acetoacetate--CoA ligase [Aeromicrobium endophyticum]|uniref:Acetoacetate--CoA ligase n=1 Tax=Aeromicrobium endophyticum TaxID=2292704 RepID=A0A371NYU2_9ACTN|nr:acetoacetate--CoA ligase [Aeromicrobium endophyticum]REK68865.1 acetoacetate--CoA ligase [Aeromicrobium endophyticum]
MSIATNGGRVSRPDAPIPGGTAMARFAAGVAERHQLDVSDYGLLHHWSVTEPEAFWAEVWEFFGVVASCPFDAVLDSRRMPGARWFDGARLNYVDQVLRHAGRLTTPAVVAILEDGTRRELGWDELHRRVAGFAATLRAQGVVPGDRVVGYLPNADEAIVAFLGTAAVGAVWACCAPDYGTSAAADRLAQLEPTVLVGATAYVFGGVLRDRRDVLAQLADALAPRLVITVPRGGIDVSDETFASDQNWLPWATAVEGAGARIELPLATAQVPPDHPLWVLFSSGTTGVPKGIVHGHAGVVVTHLLTVGLHQDLREGDTLFWYTTTNWMLWNVVVGALLAGVTTIAYEGSPVHPTVDRLWSIVEQEQVTQIGTSPGLLQLASSAGLRPGEDHDLGSLDQIMATGAPVSEALHEWVRDAVSPDVPLVSTSGGTDVVSSFVGGAPGLHAGPGEIPGPVLGVAAEAFDEHGTAVLDVVGELVVTVPMPSMPVRFWNDPDGERYRDAYFDMYPGIWRHGDWITHTSRGTFVVHGRSDSTLNRNGVRLGSADLYHVVEGSLGVQEALVLGVERPDGTYRMPMFLVPQPGASIEDDTIAAVKQKLRTECSPRHVPDEFHVVEAIPHTKTGKKLEVPLKRILQGADARAVLSTGAVDRPELIAYYVDLAQQWSGDDSQTRSPASRSQT